jgi:SAM-dependent methyltransferase
MVAQGDSQEIDQLILRGLRRLVGRFPGVRVGHRLLAALNEGFGAAFVRWPGALFWYLRDFHRLRAASTSADYELSSSHLFPCLTDKRSHTPVNPVYFFQDTWAARKIFQLKPSHHYDVGSSVMTMGILSQLVPTTMIDIRPIELTLAGLSFEKGSILDLPFATDTIESLSSLCVIEHVGLGRYGDEIDPRGSEKAVSELKRVLRTGGSLFLSVPVDSRVRIYFNAHRAFTRDYLVQLFDGLEIVEEKYQYGNSLCDHYDRASGFGTGMFHLRKKAA